MCNSQDFCQIWADFEGLRNGLRDLRDCSRDLRDLREQLKDINRGRKEEERAAESKGREISREREGWVAAHACEEASGVVEAAEMEAGGGRCKLP